MKEYFVTTGDADASAILLHPDYDIGKFVKRKATDLEKNYILTTKWKPVKNFNWPFSLKKQGQKQFRRSLQQSHIEQYPEFAYSVTLDGVFCKICVLSRVEEATH